MLNYHKAVVEMLIYLNFSLRLHLFVKKFYADRRKRD